MFVGTARVDTCRNTVQKSEDGALLIKKGRLKYRLATTEDEKSFGKLYSPVIAVELNEAEDQVKGSYNVIPLERGAEAIVDIHTNPLTGHKAGCRVMHKTCSVTQ
jgi:uncharacterized beta-barrel protein YwiB (DUF1934 family)